MNKLHSLLPLAFILPAIAWSQNTFPSTGNVGIGTTSPTAKLTIAETAGGSSGTTPLLITSNDTWGQGFGMSNSTSNANWLFYVGGSSNTAMGAGSLYFYNGSIRLGITSTGNVGIGTTTPGSKLTVAGTASFGNWGYLSIGDATPGFNNLTTNQDATFLIGENLTFAGASSNTPLVTPQSHGALSGAGMMIGGNGASINGVQTNDIGFFTNAPAPVTSGATMSAVPALIIKSSRYVGIGTMNPTHLLTVKGAIRANEVIVDTGWSDYVFKPDYRLAPLAEVQKTIEQEGHLPGLPSAKEVAEHGISIGDMQAKLLAKIEELTLHQIEQEKEQAHLRQRVDQLEKENASLRSRGSPDRS